MANPVILSASGDVLVIKGSARGGVGPTILTFTGASWVGSAVVKINTAYPGEAVSLVTVAYTNRATGATVAAGTAITADAVIEVGQNQADIYLTYTHTSGTCNVVTLEAPMNSRVPNPLDVDVSIFDTSLTSASGKIGLGASPGSTAALNVDGASYSGVAVRFVHGTADFKISLTNNSHTDLMVVDASAIRLGTTNQLKWAIPATAAGTSTFTSQQAIAQFVGGATSTTFYQSNGSTAALFYNSSNQVVTGSATAFTGASVSLRGSVTASSGNAIGIANVTTLVAAANSDVLTGKYIAPTLTPGAFTGLVVRQLYVEAFSVAAYTTPGNPVGIGVGIITGTGASVATALQLAPPTGATTNYLIAHTTPATFNVTAAGAITSAAGIVAVGIRSNTSGFAVATSATTEFAYRTSLTLTGATTQQSFRASGVYDSGATVAAAGYYAGDTTAAAAYTLPLRAGFYAASVAKGAGSTITNDVGFYAEGPTQGGTINASAFLHATIAAPATAGAVAAGVPIRMYSGGITIEVTSDAPTHTRAKGSICINTGGSSGTTRLYINTDSGTTWTALNTVA